MYQEQLSTHRDGPDIPPVEVTSVLSATAATSSEGMQMSDDEPGHTIEPLEKEAMSSASAEMTSESVHVSDDVSSTSI